MSLFQVLKGQGATSAMFEQFRQLLLGLMPDQIVTVGQQLRVIGRNLVLQQLTGPSILSYTLAGSTGGTATANYQIVASNDDGDSIPGAVFAINNLPNVLSGSIYATLLWQVDSPAGSGYGAKNFKVLKQAGKTGPWTYIKTVPFVQGQTAYSVNDDGSYSPNTSYSAVTTGPGGQLVLPPWTSYTPAVATTASQPTVPIGGTAGTIVGKYTRMGKLVLVRIVWTWGSGTSGGTGPYNFSLPFASVGDGTEQELVCSAVTLNGLNKRWSGIATITPGASICVPYLPQDDTHSHLEQARTSINPLTVGTGIPNTGSVYPYGAGSFFEITGMYEAA